MSGQESAPVSKRRRSKWDVTGDDDKQQQVANNESRVEQRTSFAADATQKARERAAELAAKLAAQGKLATGAPPPPIVIPPASFRPKSFDAKLGGNTQHCKDQAIPQDPQIIKLESGAYLADFEINDLPSRPKPGISIAEIACHIYHQITAIGLLILLSRVNLIKKAVQEKIFQQSGASITTRGRYMQPEEKKSLLASGEKPLYLSIQAAIHAKVQVALHKIKDVIRNFENAGAVGKLFSGAQNTTLNYVQDKMYVGLEHVALNYNVREKLEGPNGSFFNHIMTQTGAKVNLRGKGSMYLEPNSGRESFVPLHIYISHPDRNGLYQAKSLCEDLLKSVHNDFKCWNQMGNISNNTEHFQVGQQQPVISYPALNETSVYNPAQPPTNIPPSGYQQPSQIEKFYPATAYPTLQYPAYHPSLSYPPHQGDAATAYPTPEHDVPYSYPQQGIHSPKISEEAKGNDSNQVVDGRPERKRRRFREATSKAFEKTSVVRQPDQCRSSWHEKPTGSAGAPELIRKSTETIENQESHSHSLDSNTNFRSAAKEHENSGASFSREQTSESSSRHSLKDDDGGFKAPAFPLPSMTKKSKATSSHVKSSPKNPLSSLIPYSADSDSD
eukprot:gene10014-11037_t